MQTTLPPQGLFGVLEERITELAKDVGRLSRRVEAGSSLQHQADRLAGHVESLYLIVSPTAGELVAWHAPGDPVAIDEAIAIVDARWARLQTRLGKTAA